jgi:hypothetical protein
MRVRSHSLNVQPDVFAESLDDFAEVHATSEYRKQSEDISSKARNEKTRRRRCRQERKGKVKSKK